MIHEEDQMVCCPYNMAHVILKPRMAAHLIKCRLQHPSEGFSTCPFNSTHDVPTPELQYHIENCMDRRKLDSFVYVMDDTKQKDEAEFHVELPPLTENWDEESRTTGSYLDIKNKVVEKKPVFRIPVGMSKAERKAFFRQEVERFGNVSTENPPTSSSRRNTSEVSSNSSKNASSCKREENMNQKDDIIKSGGPKVSDMKAIADPSEEDFHVVTRRKSSGRGLTIM